MKRMLSVIIAGFVTVGFASTANAIVLIPGAGVTPTAGVAPSAGYGVQLDSLILPYSFGSVGNMTGSVTAKVFKNSTGMLFTYDIIRNADGVDEYISRMSTASFQGFTVDADYDPATVGDSIGKDVDRISDSVVGFNFDPRLGALGGDTKQLWIQTNASAYGPGTISLIDGQALNLAGFAPTSAVPEPASLSLLGMGIAGLLRIKRKAGRPATRLS